VAKLRAVSLADQKNEKWKKLKIVTLFTQHKDRQVEQKHLQH